MSPHNTWTPSLWGQLLCLLGAVELLPMVRPAGAAFPPQQHPLSAQHQSHPEHLTFIIFPCCAKQTTYSGHPLGKLLQLQADGEGEHWAAPVMLPLNSFWEHPGPSLIDQHSGLHNGKSMQKYFSCNAFQFTHMSLQC